MVNQNKNKDLGELIRQARVAKRLTQGQLCVMSGVSASHLGRIERGDRYPSGAVLRKIAEPLGFGEGELFTLAGYLTPAQQSLALEGSPRYIGRLDPYVARVLAQEPVEVQRIVIGILSILKGISRASGSNGAGGG